MNSITLRPATSADLLFLWEMLFESAFTTEEARAAWRADPQRPPELMKYLDGWGRAGDAGVVAEDGEGVRLLVPSAFHAPARACRWPLVARQPC